MRESTHTKEMKITTSDTTEGLHVMTGHKEQCPDTETKFHSLVLVFSTEKVRVVYFQQKEQQMKCFEKLIALQGFKSQLGQFQIGPERLDVLRDTRHA